MAQEAGVGGMEPMKKWMKSGEASWVLLMRMLREYWWVRGRGFVVVEDREVVLVKRRVMRGVAGGP